VVREIFYRRHCCILNAVVREDPLRPSRTLLTDLLQNDSHYTNERAQDRAAQEQISELIENAVELVSNSGRHLYKWDEHEETCDHSGADGKEEDLYTRLVRAHRPRTREDREHPLQQANKRPRQG
jgi:hypothetical protein